MSHDKHKHDERRKDDHYEKAVLHELKQLVILGHEQLSCLRQILKHLQPITVTHSIVVRFKEGLVQQNNVCVLNVGQTSQANIVALLADGIAPSGGAVSNVVFNFNDPSATVVLNGDGITATVTGVAESNGPIGGNVTCTITDTDGAVSQWNQSFTVQVNGGAPPPEQLTQSIAVQFGDPVDSGNSNQPVTGVAVAGTKPNKPLNE